MPSHSVLCFLGGSRAPRSFLPVPVTLLRQPSTPWSRCTYSKHGENPVFGEAMGCPELLINVAVEVLHPPNGLILQLAVQGVLLLHVLGVGKQQRED